LETFPYTSVRNENAILDGGGGNISVYFRNVRVTEVKSLVYEYVILRRRRPWRQRFRCEPKRWEFGGVGYLHIRRGGRWIIIRRTRVYFGAKNGKKTFL